MNDVNRNTMQEFLNLVPKIVAKTATPKDICRAPAGALQISFLPGS